MTPGQGDRAGEERRLADQALRIARLALDAGGREDGTSRRHYDAVFHAAAASKSCALAAGPDEADPPPDH